jgi:tRNA (guanine-N7-)-methyltransferase
LNSVTPVNDEVRRNFYGRFKGHGITKAQKELLKTELNDISLKSVSVEDNPNRVPLDIESYFDNKPVWLEVGFGSGEHLIYQATCNPDVSFIGCEPYINGVVSFLGKVKRQKIKNIFLYAGDVRDLFDVLPSNSLAKVFLLYPDPWPKRRHKRRRFVNPEYLIPLLRVMNENAELRIATDIEDYFKHTKIEVLKLDFKLTKQNGDKFDLPWSDWFPTRYEKKAKLQNRKSYYATFEKKLISIV